MKHKFLNQKNKFSNNLDSNLSGIYGIIGENSNIEIINTNFSKNNYSDIVLNNAKFVGDSTEQITINTINNSQITCRNKNYIINGEKDGGRAQFPVPNFQQSTDLKVNNKSSSLYPSQFLSVSKDIATNLISTFFLDFSDSTLYTNLEFFINSKNLVYKCLSNNNNIAAYNKGGISANGYMYQIFNLIKNLPHSMNGYTYTFNFDIYNESNYYSECLNFKDFHGGNIILNFNYIQSTKDEHTYHNTINFLNCDNIKINGNNVQFYSSTDGWAEFLRPIFSFDNCHTIEINNCNFQKCYYVDETTKDIKTFYSDIYFCGNSNKYETGGCIILKNSNIIFNNCSFVHRDGGTDGKYKINDKYISLSDQSNSFNTICHRDIYRNLTTFNQYSIIAFNSKILFDRVLFNYSKIHPKPKHKLKLILDQFSTASYNSTLNSLQEIQNEITSANILTENYINNGLLNHYHTDYLTKTNTTPVGTVVGYGMWYRQEQYSNILSSLVSKYHVPDNDISKISGIAAISAGIQFNKLPGSFLPLCCPSDYAYILTSLFYDQFNSLSGSETNALYNKNIFFDSTQLKIYQFGKNNLISGTNISKLQNENAKLKCSCYNERVSTPDFTTLAYNFSLDVRWFTFTSYTLFWYTFNLV